MSLHSVPLCEVSSCGFVVCRERKLNIIIFISVKYVVSSCLSVLVNVLVFVIRYV